MKHLEEHQIQGNRNDQDVLMYYTTTGSQPILQNSCFTQSFNFYNIHPTLLKPDWHYVKYHFRVDDVELDGFRTGVGYNTCFI